MSMPFVDLKSQFARIEDDVRKAMDAVLVHGQYVMGPEVTRAEAELAKLGGVKHCLTCASGTDALVMALMALGIGPGDGVLTTPYTFIATVEAIALVGATPVFVDVDPKTFNIDPQALERTLEALEHNDPALAPLPANHGDINARAVMPVDLFGQPADYEAILAIAERHGLEVIGDAAQSYGAVYKNKPTVAWPRVSGTSFFPAKVLGCYGDGGAVFTDDDELADIMTSVRVHGMGSNRYDNVRIGLNARFDTLQAAVILTKLPIFEAELDARRAVAARYDQALADVATVPHIAAGCVSVYAQYSILTDRRDELRKALGEEDIPSAVYYVLPNHLQPGYTYLGYKSGDMPVSEELSRTMVSLPMHPYLSEADQERVIAAVLKALS